ncbi:MAG: formyltransferase family protein [Bacteriovoracaceae bacterium]
MSLRAVLVTSEVTFVGENYHQVILTLAKNPHIRALVVIQNREPRLSALGFVAAISGAAPRFGFQLFTNNLFPRTDEKVRAYEKEGKEVFFTKDINSPESLQYLRSLTLDLVVNARSRCFFRDEVLALPRLGCINIHHGLLPFQRGVMCDFWAHMYGRPFGFTVHQMTKKIDDGPILRVEEMKLAAESYTKSIFEGSKREAQVLAEVLDDIDKKQVIEGQLNQKTSETKYWKNPKLMDFYRLRLKGIKV